MNKLFSAFALGLICASLFTSCSQDDDNTPKPEPKEEAIANIILDTDLGNCTDDVGAMQALFYYKSIGECNVVGVVNSFKNNQAKRLLDGFIHYYKADGIPLGFVDGDEPKFFEIVPYCHLADSTKADGTPLFPPTGIPVEDRISGWKLYRKLLSEAKDSSISIVCVGHFTNLGLLLDSPADEYSSLTGMELVDKKVRSLHLTGGCFEKVPRRYITERDTSKYIDVEYNIAGDVPLARKVIDGWPGDVIMLPLEAGMPFPSIHYSILKDTKYDMSSPLYQIYSRYNEWATGDVGQYMWDVLTTINAVEGHKLFDYSEKCTIDISETGKTTKSSSIYDNTYIVKVKESEEDAVWDLFKKFLQPF